MQETLIGAGRSGNLAQPAAVRRRGVLAGLARRSKWCVVAYHLLRGTLIRCHAWPTEWRAASGSTHAHKSLAESVQYIETVFDDYLTCGGLSIRELRDKRILEIGPGDNLGVALKFLAAGARCVVALDRFFSPRDDARQCRVYRELGRAMSAWSRQNLDGLLTGRGDLRLDSDRLAYRWGQGIEDAQELLHGESFDLIVSRAVLQEIDDLDAAFAVMDRALAPGGLMLHRIGCGDYGMFSGGGMHPLTFLTLPETLYAWMTKRTGMPNRKRMNSYAEQLRSRGYRTEVLVTRAIGHATDLVPHKPIDEFAAQCCDDALSLCRSIRPQLAQAFRNATDMDLVVSGIFLVGAKPEGGGAAGPRDGRRAGR